MCFRSPLLFFSSGSTHGRRFVGYDELCVCEGLFFTSTLTKVRSFGHASVRAYGNKSKRGLGMEHQPLDHDGECCSIDTNTTKNLVRYLTLEIKIQY